jgi:isocitrate dehydrogenase (NAD+)
MFEAIHGSAPRMVKEGREIYADPCSIIKAGSMLLSHIGYKAEADKILKALDICTVTEKKIVITGRESGATSEQFTNYILDIIGKN